jgi:1,4-dihydroxy-2-naphthoate octaprenyltransferase
MPKTSFSDQTCDSGNEKLRGEVICERDHGFHQISVRIGDREANMLWTIFVVLLVLWLLGFSLHIGGALIHLLLVVGLVVLVINLLSGRRSAV